ncbi:unnamed protein product [Trichobilharzia szidati]|nr:unnamed protein product [Trichobilharzia szidati]
MDYLCKQFKNLQCLLISDYLKHEKFYTTTASQDLILTTPELMISLRRICYKFGIIQSANQFADNLSSNYSTIQGNIDRLELNFSNLISQGYALLKQLYDECSIANISKITDNSIELVLYNIYTKVSQYEKQLEPFYELARQRIELTNNRLNVSDQLIGYRNNLNCINPTKYTQVYQPKSFSQEKRPQMPSRFNIVNYNEIKCNSVNQSNVEQKCDYVQWPSTIQEQVGIWPYYPGKSETHTAFTKPQHSVSEVLTNHGQLRSCTPGYRINPHSEIKLHGFVNTMNKENQSVGTIDQSEYRQAYNLPDGKKIHTSPWNRSREFNPM